MSILIFLIIISFLVLVHELGHFLAARRWGIKVEEFGIGYPPRAMTLFTDKHGTKYSLNWLPFGGFVRLYGEESEEIVDKKSKKEGAFYLASKKVRLVVILAGVLMNFLFGVIVFGAIYTRTGIPTELGYVRIDEVVEESPADQAGLLVGDKIVAVGESDQPVTIMSEFIDFLVAHQGEEAEIVYERDGVRSRTNVYVRLEEEIPKDQGATGVAVSDVEFVHHPLWQMPFRGMWIGFEAAFGFGFMIISALWMMITDLIFSGVVPADLAGPVGIGHRVVSEGLLTTRLFSERNFIFSAIISLNLVVINLLPIPALDGGRALFVILEKVIGRRVRPKIERWANSIGMAFLLLLIVLVSIRDIGRVFADAAVKQWWDGVRDFFLRK